MRFRKSIQICKGVRIHLSKSGVSCTVGTKGISANIGKDGVFLNTGIPGTGIYDRKRILGGSTSKAQKPQTRPEPTDLQFLLAEDGSIVVKTHGGRVITDPQELKRIRATDSYQRAQEDLMQQYKAQIEAQDEVTDIVKHCADVPTAGDFERALNAPQSAATAQPFVEPMPDKEAIRSALTADAEKYVQSAAFWTLDRKREEYVEAHLEEAYSSACIQWQARKAAYEAQQGGPADPNQINEARTDLQRAINGDAEFIEATLDKWLHSLELPVDFNVQYELHPEKNLILVDIDLPEIESMPSEKAVELASGAVKAKPKTQKELQEDYVRCVLGLAMFFASHFFCVSPKIETILASGYTQRRNEKTGEAEDEYVYSIFFDRKSFEKTALARQQPSTFCGQFKSRILMQSTGKLKAIIPYTLNDLT